MPGKTLEEIEGFVWPEQEWDLGKRCNLVRKKPIDELTIADIALLTRQNASHATLVPMAISILEREPMAEGDLYPGELLMAVLGVKQHFWEAQPDLAAKVMAIANRVYEIVRQTKPMETGGTEHLLMAEIEWFRQKCAKVL